MSDVLDRLGAQLREAERELAPAAVSAPRPAGRRWYRRRGAVIALAAVLLSGSALAAAIQPWNPLAGTTAVTTPAPPPASALAALGVLRRPQTPRDRGPLTTALLRLVEQQYAIVRIDYVRLLQASNGRRVVLVPIQRRLSGPRSPNICMIVGDAYFGHTNASGTTFCVNAGGLRQHGLTASAGGDIFGVVPDGVARVVLRYHDGTTLSARVRDNFFWIRGGATTSSPIGAVASPHSTRWLDPRGRLVGPR